MAIHTTLLLLALQGMTLSATGHTPYDPGRIYNTPDLSHAPAPYTAQTKPDPKYPLRVHVIQMAPHYTDRGFVGYGAGDLLGPTARGMDFTFRCQKAMLDNRNTPNFYQARWKKPGDNIQFLLMSEDGKHETTCSARVFFRSKPYSQYLATTPARP